MENADDGDLGPDRRVSDAFRWAVAREYEAIGLHGWAADMHEATASRLQEMADSGTDHDVAAGRRGGADIDCTGGGCTDSRGGRSQTTDRRGPF
jgi:hypothetical protein